MDVEFFIIFIELNRKKEEKLQINNIIRKRVNFFNV
jgi:hypothetical protein